VLLDGAAQPAAPTAANVNALMDAALAFLTAHADAWPFQAPVDRRDAPDYYDVVRDPVDLSLVKCRLGTRSYYLTLDMFVADVRRMLANCR
jgi:histone acetyltransferase